MVLCHYRWTWCLPPSFHVKLLPVHFQRSKHFSSCNTNMTFHLYFFFQCDELSSAHGTTIPVEFEVCSLCAVFILLQNISVIKTSCVYVYINLLQVGEKFKKNATSLSLGIVYFRSMVLIQLKFKVGRRLLQIGSLAMVLILLSRFVFR